MSIQTATPYLILGGNARKAIELYSRALDARTEELQTFGEIDIACPKARRDHVMHAAVRIGNALIMLSDGPDDSEAPSQPGTVSVALDFDDESELRQRFESLAATGKRVMPVFDAPWGAAFGVVQDEFGVSWMLNCTKSN